MFDQLAPPKGNPAVTTSLRCVPVIAQRPATAAELRGLAPWLALQGLPSDGAGVVIYADGNERHAPETVAAYGLLMRDQPAMTGLLYLHCGVQAQCLDPLLPSLLRLTGHRGPVHALRHADGHDLPVGLSHNAAVFLQAMTPVGGRTLVIDDRQNRIAGPGPAIAAPVTLTLFCRATAGTSPQEHDAHDND